MSTPIIITDPVFKLGGTDYSDGTAEVSFMVDVDTQDTTHARSGGWKAEAGGLKQGTLTVKRNADADRGGLDAYLWANMGEVVTFEAAHRNAAAAPETPHFTGSVLINKAHGVAGSIGQKETYDLTFKTSGPVTRAVA